MPIEISLQLGKHSLRRVAIFNTYGRSVCLPLIFLNLLHITIIVAINQVFLISHLNCNNQYIINSQLTDNFNNRNILPLALGALMSTVAYTESIVNHPVKRYIGDIWTICGCVFFIFSCYFCRFSTIYSFYHFLNNSIFGYLTRLSEISDTIVLKGDLIFYLMLLLARKHLPLTATNTYTNGNLPLGQGRQS